MAHEVCCLENALCLCPLLICATASPPPCRPRSTHSWATRRRGPGRWARHCTWSAGPCATCCWAAPRWTWTWCWPATRRALTEALAAAYGLKRTPYPAFGTFTLALTGPLAPVTPCRPHLNLVTARREIYPTPAALPVVISGTLADDLARRDFTINALALPLDPPGGPLLDPHGGQADLQAGLIRVLHERSFTDDPTRIFRAARYAARFGFTVEPHTLALLQAEVAHGGIAPLEWGAHPQRTIPHSGRGRPWPGAGLAGRMGVLAAVDPALHWDAGIAAEVRRVAAAAEAGTIPAGPCPATGRCWRPGWRGAI